MLYHPSSKKEEPLAIYVIPDQQIDSCARLRVPHLASPSEHGYDSNRHTRLYSGMKRHKLDSSGSPAAASNDYDTECYIGQYHVGTWSIRHRKLIIVYITKW